MTIRRADKFFAVAIALFLLAVPAVDVAYLALNRPLPGREPFRKARTPEFPAALFDGKAAKFIEQSQQNNSLVARGILGPFNETVYRLTRRHGPAVRLGGDRYLFLHDHVIELRSHHAEEHVRQNVAYLARVNQILREHGSHLIVALVPDRSRLNPERAYLDGSPPNRARYLPSLTIVLEHEGVHVINLTDPLLELKSTGEAPTYADDHHWTSKAAEVSAQHIANEAHLRRAKRFVPARPRWERGHSEHSLLRKLGFRPGSSLEDRFRDDAPFATFRRGRTHRGSRPCATYWTTSFGRFGSPQFFERALGCPVRVIQGRGKGSAYGVRTDLLPLLALLDRGELAPGHVVVWEIPEYHTLSTSEQTPGYLRQLERFLRSEGFGVPPQLKR